MIVASLGGASSVSVLWHWRNGCSLLVLTPAKKICFGTIGLVASYRRYAKDFLFPDERFQHGSIFALLTPEACSIEPQSLFLWEKWPFNAIISKFCYKMIHQHTDSHTLPSFVKINIAEVTKLVCGIIKQESPAVADKPARRLRKVYTVYVRAVGL